MKLTFLGATETVTGSKYLLEEKGRRILVDCGLFQGVKALRLQNWESLPVEPATIDAVVLTHAHIDHSGYLPKLFRDGFRGPVYCTPPTKALCEILLLDSAKLMEEEARYANKKGFSKHKPALPLFTTEDTEQVLESFNTVPFGQETGIDGDFRIRYGRAGHILGAANLVIRSGDLRVGFSGDIGRLRDPVMVEPEAMPAVDVLIVESTYGNRAHLNSDPVQELNDAVQLASSRGGSVLIPSFAVGRAQQILYYLMKLQQDVGAPLPPIFLDSPMATNVTALYREFPREHRLTAQELERLGAGVRYVRDVEESKLIQLRTDSRIIISASGMATGGRVLHYLKKMAPRKQDVILFVGYQAVGTRGASLVAGVEEIKIHGEYVPVHARVLNLENLSAHADAGEILKWLSGSKMSPRVFVTHGEPAAADALRLQIKDRFGWRCEVPAHGQSFDL